MADQASILNFTSNTNVKFTKGAQTGTDPTFGLPIFPLTIGVYKTIGITTDASTGLKGMIQIPFAGGIIGWSLVADQSGSASFEIWKRASSAPPSAPAIPTSANKISASAPCALSSAQSAAVAAAGVSTWTTAVAQWDVIAFQLNSAATVTRLTLQLLFQGS